MVPQIRGFPGMIESGGYSRDSKDAIGFHDALAGQWAASYGKGGFSRRLRVFRDLLVDVSREGGRWLDLGCGAGILTMELLSRGVRVIALDGSRGMLDSAKIVCSQFSEEVEWRLGDARDLGFIPDCGVDGIVCSSVVEYLDSADPLFREAARVLVPGGDFIVSIPPKRSALRQLQKSLRWIFGWFGLSLNDYLSFSVLEISRSEVEFLMKKHGFQVVAVRKFDPVLPAWLLSAVNPALNVFHAKKMNQGG